MTAVLRPENAAQVLDTVAWAVSQDAPLEVLGTGTKRALGRPLTHLGNIGHTLDLSALAGITLYEPEELVLSAGPATPLAEIAATLAAKGQELAFEPPDYGPLLGAPAGGGTVGGVVACNLAGPRRFKAGAARDHFLGFEAVSGRGEAFKSGGRVVKNVTGYDLCKLMAGSWGTLGVMTTLTLKVLPKAEKTRTVLVFGLDMVAAGKAMTEALRSPYEVSAAAFLPAGLAARSTVIYVTGAETSVTAIRVEGPGPSVEYRCRKLRDAFAACGATEELHGHNSGAFWTEIRDVRPFVPRGGALDGRCVWKISVPQKDGPALADGLTAELGGEAFLDWGGGLVWFAVEAPDAAHERIRAALPATGGGHATLIRAPEGVRATVPVFHPPQPGVARLSQRVKQGFDPKGILNPGRIYAGV